MPWPYIDLISWNKLLSHDIIDPNDLKSVQNGQQRDVRRAARAVQGCVERGIMPIQAVTDTNDVASHPLQPG